MAVEIRNKIQRNNELEIELNLEKNKITHITKGIRLLGYKFGRRCLFVQTKRGTKSYKRKMTMPILDVDMKKVIANLARAKFCDGDGNPTPSGF
jgi:hypothetical protein